MKLLTGMFCSAALMAQSPPLSRNPCALTSIGHPFGGVPRLGWTLWLDLQGPASAWVFLVGGLDDFAAGALPALLPGGCFLDISPDAVLPYQLSAGGVASHLLTIPGWPGLFGASLFFQWVHVDATGFSTSNATVHWIGL